MATNNVQRDRLAAARADLERMTAALTDSDEFRRLLRARRSFRKYSLNNTWLIALQRPDAVAVKGFKAWIELGRCVRKGERAIWILAPRPYKSEKSDGTVEERVGFTTVAVFDYAQTDPIDGHPDPFVITDGLGPAALGDDDLATRGFGALVDVLAADGVSASRADIVDPGTGGFYNRSRRLVAVNDRLDAPSAFGVLIHEAAHHFGFDLDGGDYAAGEVIAEQTAYLVMDHYGFDSKAGSSDYLAHWVAGDPAKLATAADVIVDLAMDLIGRIDAAMAGAAAPAIAAA